MRYSRKHTTGFCVGYEPTTEEVHFHAHHKGKLTSYLGSTPVSSVSNVLYSMFLVLMYGNSRRFIIEDGQRRYKKINGLPSNSTCVNGIWS